MGMFHGLDAILRSAIIQVGMKDAPRTRAVNNEAIELQRKAKQAKEDIKKEKNMEKATELYIEAIYYFRMYDSLACWKGSVKRVDEGLKRLTSETARYEALKENIMMRVKGFGWEWAKHAWTKNKRKYSVKELAKWLKFIITEEKKASIKKTTPSEPPTVVPVRKENSILGTQCEYVKSLDKKYFANEEDFKKRADQVRMEREARGEGSMYSLLQPFDRPDIMQLVGRRIDVLSFMPVIVNGEEKSVGRWCQGEVTRAYKGRNQPTVRVLWDPMPDVGGYEEARETDQCLLPTRWKKDKDNSWRTDVEVNIATNSRRDGVNKEELIEVGSESDIESESESESESEPKDSDSNSDGDDK